MAGIGNFLSSVDWTTWITGVLFGGVASAATLFVRTIIQQPVKALTEQSRVIEKLWRLSPQVPFRGQWKIVWSVESDRYQKDNPDVVHIRRLFSNVTFSTRTELTDGSVQHCVFVGKLLNGAVTGRWYNPEDQEHGYFGAFQFRVHGSLRSAAGAWIGWRNDGTVASGDLALTRT